MGQQGFDVSRLTMGQKILFVTGAVFLIVLFLPWEDFGFGISLSGFSGIGVLAGLLVIGLLVWEGINVAGVNLNLNISAALIGAALAGATVLFGLIRFLTALSPSPGFGAWLGLIVLIGMAYGAFVRFQESQTGEAPPPAPPAS
jgi:hypothetical protein